MDEAYWLKSAIQTLHPTFSLPPAAKRDKKTSPRPDPGVIYGGELGTTQSHYSLTAAICTYHNTLNTPYKSFDHQHVLHRHTTVGRIAPLSNPLRSWPRLILTCKIWVSTRLLVRDLQHTVDESLWSRQDSRARKVVRTPEKIVPTMQTPPPMLLTKLGDTIGIDSRGRVDQDLTVANSTRASQLSGRRRSTLQTPPPMLLTVLETRSVET